MIEPADSLTENHTDDVNFLNNFGGLNKNSLNCVLQAAECEQDRSENDEIEMISHSSYYEINALKETLNGKHKQFSVFSSNIDSIFKKFNSLYSYLNNYDSQFSAICLQECHLAENSDLSMYQLKNYNCISLSKKCSSKGGLMIYLHEKFSYKIKNFYTHSDIWEGQFIEIFHDSFKKPIILGNIYRPPRDTHTEFF
jgi:hypothetical protein